MPVPPNDDPRARQGRGLQRNWSRDELILALEVYLRIRPGTPSPDAHEIQELSALLRRIAKVDDVRFRSAASVVMKLMNFRSLDPSYPGKGLSAAGALDREVWASFSDDPPLLSQLAETLRAGFARFSDEAAGADNFGRITEASEGALLTRVHLVRERSRALVLAKKAAVIEAFGALCCEACEIRHADLYGPRGDDVMECHHRTPLHTLRPGDRTRLDDLALICANWHRIIHASRPWLSVEDVRSTVLARS